MHIFNTYYLVDSSLHQTKVSNVHKSSEAVALKCQEISSSIKRKKKKSDLDAIGWQANNNLVDPLR